MSVTIRLYGTGEADAIPWKDVDVPYNDRVWMEAFLRDGAQKYIQNVETRFCILQLNQWLFPLTVNDTEYGNAYVCSPYTHYVSYAREELKHLNAPVLEKGLASLLTLAGLALKAGHINRTVHVNNWLLSTNLYPNWRGEHLKELTNWLTQRFPEHAIVFRSLNEKTEQGKLSVFQDVGYHLLPSRQVYFLNGQEANFLKKRDVKNDIALNKKTAYQIVSNASLTTHDILRIVSLYNDLYLDKYSHHNPQFTEAFIKLCLDNDLLTIHGLRGADGLLQGVIGYFERNGTMTTPLVGYNRSRPQQEGLYRLLTLTVLQDTAKKGRLFNMSSGAASFKRSRGAEAAFEYSAVLNRHLPIARRLPWNILVSLACQIAKPLMQKYRL